MGMLRTFIGTRVPEKYRKYFDLPKREASWKIGHTLATALGRAVYEWIENNADNCGVYRLDNGAQALGVRVGLIEVAERTIDIQSYLIHDDLSGNLIVLRLIEAADRGVRVRLLMDDALTEPIDEGLTAISRHPNIEVRVFNPFPRRRNRIISFIANFNILNRRMHNKSFTVDNQVTIIGGRNIGDEYFQTSDRHEFLDEDLMLIGPIVDEVSTGFDEYWNFPEAMPIQVFDPFVEYQPLRDTVAEGRRFLEKYDDSLFLNRVDDALVRQIMDGSLSWLAAPATLIQDAPDKVRRIVRREPSRTSVHLQAMVSSATREIVIVSPYFVPQKRGVSLFADMVRRGIRVVVITNSLASTNHASVHAVYERYRKPLLRRGIELYELRAHGINNVEEAAAATKTTLTLHSKVAVIDKARVFVGSFNLDPRSLYLNTEMGVNVESEVLAGMMADDIVDALEKTTYRLRLRDNRRLQWVYLADGVEMHANKEPHTSLWRRIRTRLMGYLPIEGQM